jgi:hypothetical protein
MTRITAIICFTFTLFCPVFCLANTDNDCPAHAQEESDNCEAMAIGAVVAKPGVSLVSPHQFLLSFEGFLLPPAADLASSRELRTDADRRQAKPPPSARRQALLQNFLF